MDWEEGTKVVTKHTVEQKGELGWAMAHVVTLGHHRKIVVLEIEGDGIQSGQHTWDTAPDGEPWTEEKLRDAEFEQHVLVWTHGLDREGNATGMWVRADERRQSR